MAKKQIAPIAASAGNVKKNRDSATHNFKEIPKVSGEVVTVKAVEGRFAAQARVALKGPGGKAIVCFLPVGWLSLESHVGERVTITREVDGDDFSGRSVKWSVETAD
jgi:hypothetical protein